MKKQIKLVALSTFSFLAIIAIVFSSCEKQEQNFGPTTYYKPCQDVICLNGGTCHDGNCLCAVGFEGTKCETRSVDKFVATYDAFDDCFMSGSQSYEVTIQADFDPINQLTLKGFAKTFCPNDITAYISSEKSNFDIPFQQTCSNYYVSGEGNMSGSVLNVNLSFRDSLLHTTYNCGILLNKK